MTGYDDVFPRRALRESEEFTQQTLFVYTTVLPQQHRQPSSSIHAGPRAQFDTTPRRPEPSSLSDLDLEACSNSSVSSRSRSVIPTRARRRLSDALSDSHVSQKTTSPNNTETARRSSSHDASDPPCCTGTHDIRGRSHSSYTSRNPGPSPLENHSLATHVAEMSSRTRPPVIILGPSEDSRKTTDPASDASIAQAATEHRNPVCK